MPAAFALSEMASFRFFCFRKQMFGRFWDRSEFDHVINHSFSKPERIFRGSILRVLIQAIVVSESNVF
jgi:hypothetical protein